ncbi:YhgE/Pip domain-containing protein [Mollicutes bacterium LVI A0078]|nr:YhgE/Pip domain-containing protein [Mollicutes bacterium LVI A0075]WOO91542.1 YhgE/Pip domain-containing protein [Mollicutes bacterium LVI A0078]
MKNIISIYISDLKAIAKNIPTLIIVVGLMILPSLYAWFNIAALIDPYGNASNLPIAALSLDKGTKVDGDSLNVGDEIISNLKENDELDWQFPSDIDEVNDKVNTGEYYAAIIIPDQFSSDLADAINTYQSPSIEYIVNEKVNAIAPKMTEAGAEGVTSEINSQVNSVVTKYLVDYSNELNTNIEQSSYDYNRAVDTLNNFINSFETIDNSFNSYIGYEQDVKLAIEDIEQFNSDTYQKLSSYDYTAMYAILDQVDGSDDVKSLIEEVESLTSEQVEISSSQLDNINENIKYFMYNKWPAIKNGVYKIANNLQLLESDYQSIADYLQKDSDKASEFMASPVNIETTNLYHVSNYGTASTPFYTSLCLWVGSLLMASLLSFKSKVNAKPIEEYFGKLLLFITIGFVQALIVTFGDVYLLDITVASPLYLLAFDLLISFVFVTIVYSLVYIFGNVGKALAIVVLVLSISGGGGNFPIEVSGQFFQSIYPYLPFTYAVKLLREAVSGIYMPTVVTCIQIFAGMAIATFLVSSVCVKFVKPLFDKFDNESKKAGIIH